MKYIFANWKMYLDFSETNMLAKQLVTEHLPSTNTVVVFPISIASSDVIATCRGSAIGVGAQNVAWVPKGAYTGAVSAHIYKELGCSYALVGHSERRHIFGETDEAARKKLEASFDAGIIPVVCIGETKEDREAGKREYRLKKQLMKLFDGLVIPEHATVIVAYEPVWAIGTGEACDSVEAAEIHQFIKRELRQYTKMTIPVLYGGSVDEKNVVSYLSLDPIDGVLIGSASTHIDSFTRIIHLAEKLP